MFLKRALPVLFSRPPLRSHLASLFLPGKTHLDFLPGASVLLPQERSRSVPASSSLSSRGSPFTGLLRLLSSPCPLQLSCTPDFSLISSSPCSISYPFFLSVAVRFESTPSYPLPIPPGRSHPYYCRSPFSTNASLFLLSLYPLLCCPQEQMLFPPVSSGTPPPPHRRDRPALCSMSIPSLEYVLTSILHCSVTGCPRLLTFFLPPHVCPFRRSLKVVIAGAGVGRGAPSLSSARSCFTEIACLRASKRPFTD